MSKPKLQIVKLSKDELQLATMSIQNITIKGSDSHAVSRLLTKLENGFERANKLEFENQERGRSLPANGVKPNTPPPGLPDGLMMDEKGNVKSA